MDITHNITKREELISLSAYYAESIKQHIIDSESPYIVNLLGDRNAGKSLIADTMMMALFDKYDHTLLYDQKPQKKQFLECEPGKSEYFHLNDKGLINNTPAQLSFDRLKLENEDVTDELEKAFNLAAEGSGITKGVIFANSVVTNPILQITLEFSNELRQHLNQYYGSIVKEKASKMWDRTVKISSTLKIEPFNGS